jgi:hypothetical protein
MARPRTDPKVRFWKHVNKTDYCWEWTSHKYKGGYGHFWIDGKHIGAHKQAYLWEYGSIPEGYDVDHFECDNTSCVRPSHLKAVTHAQNVQRGMDRADKSKWKPRASAAECPKGHAYDEVNTYIDPRGAKRCRVCKRSNYA